MSTLAIKQKIRGLFIGGTEVPAVSGRLIDNLDPVTGEVYLRVPAAGAEDVTRAVDAAHAAFPKWAATAPSTRRTLLENAAVLLEERTAEFTDILIQETAGTRIWAAFNIRMSAELLRQAATMATRLSGSLPVTDVSSEWSTAIRSPAGVVAVFVHWHGSLILCTRAVAVALATGNSVVIRPSEEAPIASGYFLAKVLTDVGVPADVVNVVTSDHSDTAAIVEALTADPRVRRVNFTSSTPVGRHHRTSHQ